MNYDNFTVVYMVRVGGALSCMDFDYGIWPTSEKEGRCRFIIAISVCIISWHLSLLKAQSEF